MTVLEKTKDMPENLKDLFKAGAHYAFSKSRRHPSAKPFILGVKNKLEIFDLEKTVESLSEAQEFIKKISSEGGQVLFVGGKVEARNAVKKGATEAEMPYVAGRWIGGTLTNFEEIKKRVARLEDLEKQKEKGELSKYTKKERLLIDKEIEKLREMFSGIRTLKGLPKVMFIVDPRKEYTALKEAKDKGIPVVALASSDCDLGSVDYAIPANDSSVSSIRYFVGQIVKAIEDGQKAKK